MHFFIREFRRGPLSALLCLLLAQGSQAGESLSLAAAVNQFRAANPQLQMAGWRLKALAAEQRQAGQRPPLQLGVNADQITGSGDYANAAQMELQVSLSSVLELGDQRSARLNLAGSHYALAEAERDADALQLTAALTQDFISTLALQEKLALAQAQQQLADDARTRVHERVAQGAAPRAEQSRADAFVVQARLTRAALESQLIRQKQTLASYWGEDAADLPPLSGSLQPAGVAQPFEHLYQSAQQSATLRVSAARLQVQQAERQLAQSQASAGIGWQLGVSRFSDTGDNALALGVSVPLFSGSRQQAGIAASQARENLSLAEQQQAQWQLRTRLFHAHQQYQTSVSAWHEIQSALLPALQQALSDSQHAYLRGRYSYSEWAGARNELLNARLALIDNATQALLQQALIEQLTGQPLALAVSE